ncbi:MAG TPA: hypothetical protein VI821_00055 [Candidatus Paceibacterota bacterium]
MDNIESQISDINIANEMTKMIESMRKNIDSYSATVEKNKKIEQIEQNKRSEKSAILSAEIFELLSDDAKKYIVKCQPADIAFIINDFIRIVQSRAEDYYSDALTEKLSKVASNAIEAASAQIAEYSQTLFSSIKQQRRDVAASRGETGEEYVLNVLTPYFAANLTRTSHCGDIQIGCNGAVVMIEVKNYTSPVPSREVAKFVEDVRNIRPIGAVMISLNTNITGVKGAFVRDFVLTDGAAIPVVYVTGDKPEAIVLAVEIAQAIACNISDQTLNVISSSLRNLSELRRDITQMATSTSAAFARQIDTITQIEMLIDSVIKNTRENNAKRLQITLN